MNKNEARTQCSKLKKLGIRYIQLFLADKTMNKRFSILREMGDKAM